MMVSVVFGSTGAPALQCEHSIPPGTNSEIRIVP